jgi:hypothetical protein
LRTRPSRTSPRSPSTVPGSRLGGPGFPLGWLPEPAGKWRGLGGSGSGLAERCGWALGLHARRRTRTRSYISRWPAASGQGRRSLAQRDRRLGVRRSRRCPVLVFVLDLGIRSGEEQDIVRFGVRVVEPLNDERWTVVVTSCVDDEAATIALIDAVVANDDVVAWLSPSSGGGSRRAFRDLARERSQEIEGADDPHQLAVIGDRQVVDPREPTTSLGRVVWTAWVMTSFTVFILCS